MPPLDPRHVRRIAAFALLLIAPHAAAAQPGTPGDLWLMRARADSLFAARQLAPAESLYRALARHDSTDFLLLQRLATAQLTLGKHREARALLARTFRDGPNRQEVALALARTAAQDGDKRAALDWLDSAVAHRFAPRAQLQSDSSFVTLRDDERFRRIAGALPRRRFTRDEGWRYDLAFFVAEAQRLHTSLDRPAYSAAFASAAAELDRRIPTRSDAQVLAGLQRLSVMLDDGHTAVYRRTLPKGYRRLPVDFYRFAEGTYVVGARDDLRALVGSKVLRIGRLTPDSALAAVAPYVPRDNAQGLLSVGVPFLLALPFQLEVIGAVDDTARVTLELEGRDGRRHRVTLSGDDDRQPAFLLQPPTPADSALLWLRHVDDSFWMTPLPDVGAVYFQYNAVANMPSETTTQFAERLKAALRGPGVKNLIVDVRRNRGGNSFLNPPLHLAMIAFEQASPGHHIYMLIGRHTFSAAQNFTNYVERWTNAVFVGEPTGSRPNFVGEGNQVVLPYSGVAANISNRNHQSAFWDDTRPWVAPHVAVAVTARDYFAGRDAGLDAVRDIIRKRGGASRP